MNSLALKIAWDVHKDQRRKGSNAPYIIHPIEVAVILTEYIIIFVITNVRAEDFNFNIFYC